MDHGQTTNSKNILTKEPKKMKTQNNNSRLRKKTRNTQNTNSRFKKTTNTQHKG
jgi:hypothetical protein